MAAAETPARSRVALLRRTLDGHIARLADLDAALAEMPARQRDARLAGIEKAPTKRSDALGSEVQKLREEERKLTAARETLAGEIEAASIALGRAVDAGRDELREAYQAQADEFDDVEREAWTKFGAAFATLVHAYSGVLDAAEARLDFSAAMVWESNDDRLAYEHLFRRSWQAPFPIDLPRAVEMALDASADPKGWGVHGEGLGIEVRLGHLPEVMPDLRAVYRHGRLSGGVGSNQAGSLHSDALAGRAPAGSFSSPLPARGT